MAEHRTGRERSASTRTDDDSNGSPLKPSIHRIWEKGGGRGNVTTPATSSEPYRERIVGLLRGLLAGSPSRGCSAWACGNGMVEAIIAGDGTRVLAVDAMEPAVTRAGRAKGLDAVVRRRDSTGRRRAEPWTMLFADGSLGHLYDPDTGLQHVPQPLPVLVRPRAACWCCPTTRRGPATPTRRSTADLAYWFLSQSYMERPGRRVRRSPTSRARCSASSSRRPAPGTGSWSSAAGKPTAPRRRRAGP